MARRTVVRSALVTDATQILEMFCTLWPDEPTRAHAAHIRGILTGKPRSTLPLVLFVAEVEGRLVGFVEVGLRSHANGCDGRRPVGFLEGWYVAKGLRRRGVGGQLLAAAEKWCRAQGCREMASDTWSNHRLSIAAHQALGYAIDGRYVNFRKSL
jgi:aminoglycoside 6'-N-acetyltransferase I